MTAGRYETWIGGVFHHEVPSRRPFLSPRRAVVAAGSAATWLLVLAADPLAPALRIPAAVALVVTFGAGMLVWLRTWSVAIERAHARLLLRRELGDFRRGIIFFAVFVGYGVGSSIIAGLLLWLVVR